ncbi:nuclear transport factor 2 family protein [Kiloniella sp. b19]|uniref:nuclear transport factor 2 family protein n=1 Tax=Kiloniella sp. GXU_MW_B19 TaxID=3141326 RepID=UPI0031D72C99
MSDKLTAKDLEDVFNAFNAHDVDTVMKPFSDDCVFYPVAGDTVMGTKIEGAEAIRNAFVGVWTAMPDAQWANHSHFVCDDYGVSQWTFIGTNAEGMRVEAQGVDIFKIKDGKIVEKNAFRKQRPPFKVA